MGEKRYFLFWKWIAPDGSEGAGLANHGTLEETIKDQIDFIDGETHKDSRKLTVIIEGIQLVRSDKGY